MEITFLGAAGTVTGSKYLITLGSRRILVDCGLFQGEKQWRLRNWQPLPVHPKSIDLVLLTHAHIDHSGYLPLLVKNGFSGNIYCTYGTRDLCEILLPDSAHLQEEEAYYANKHGYSKHHPALPLYTVADAEAALTFFKPVAVGEKINLFSDCHCEFFSAGHIIGASFIALTHKKTRIVFSGDLGRPQDPVMQAPAFVEQADYLGVESTYGNRVHVHTSPKESLKALILNTIARGGSVVIPAFAVGRAQTLLYYICLLKKEGAVPHDLPVYLDSPMAINATDIMMNHGNEIRLSQAMCSELHEGVQFTNAIADSKQIDLDINTSKIIISASGMVTGGRILHHLKNYASDPRHLILFAGYQTPHTRGAEMLQGKTSIKLLGERIAIAAEVQSLSNLSAHADCTELLDWLKHIKRAPRRVFITHGDDEARTALKQKIEASLHWQCVLPEYLQEIKLP